MLDLDNNNISDPKCFEYLSKWGGTELYLDNNNISDPKCFEYLANWEGQILKCNNVELEKRVLQTYTLKLSQMLNKYFIDDLSKIIMEY
jgi:hypothetical protein